MDCEIEEALYSQVHYASSLLVSETTVSGENFPSISQYF